MSDTAEQHHHKELETKVSELLKRLELVESSSENKQANFPTLKSSSENVWITMANRAISSAEKKQKLPERQIEILNSAVAEQEETEKRKQNIIIHGLSKNLSFEQSDQKLEDTKTVQKLLEAIGTENDAVEQIRRFESSKNSRAPLVWIKLKASCKRNDVLAAAKKLKGIKQFDKVFLHPDMTESERALDWNLRKQRNELNAKELEKNQPFHWSIRSNALKRFSGRHTSATNLNQSSKPSHISPPISLSSTSSSSSHNTPTSSPYLPLTITQSQQYRSSSSNSCFRSKIKK